MKYQTVRIVTAFAWAVLWFAGTAQAQLAVHRVKVNVPFEFTVNGKLHPEGEYVLVCTPGQIEVRDARSQLATLAISHSVASLNETVAPKLVFITENGRHALSQVWVGDAAYGYELPQSKTEAVLAKRGSALDQAHAGGK